MKPSNPSPRRRRRRARGLLAPAVLGLLAACGGGGGAGGGTPVFPAGVLREKPDGSVFFEDPHQNGRAPRLELVDISWGRMVDVHALADDGEPASAPTLRDFLINENIVTDADDFLLETSPITNQTRLVIRRVRGAPDAGRGTFESLLRRAATGLAGVLPKSPDSASGTPFSLVARNAGLMLRFSDLLDDDEASTLALAENVRILVGYPPDTPFPARIVFDPHHGSLVAGRFHSTRVLIDPTVTEQEAADSPVPLLRNSLGLPRSERMATSANISLRLPTEPDAGSGQFDVLRNLSGGSLAPLQPLDGSSPTRDLVRALRSGGEEDTNNGFLLDFQPPRVIGTWPGRVLEAEAQDEEARAWRLEFQFTSVCRKAPTRGDIVRSGTRFQEVVAPAGTPDPGGRIQLETRVLNAASPTREELLGEAVFESVFRPEIEVDRGCWLRFSPPAREFPNVHVAADARTTLRFSEPMDPASALPFDTLLTVRGGESAPITSTSLVVGSLVASPDLRELSFFPRLAYAHQGDEALYSVRVLGAGGVTDLAGNELDQGLPGIPFTIDPLSPRSSNGSVVLRFDSPDELETVGAPDLRGQVVYELTRGTIRPREAQFGARPVDRSNPVVGIMSGFAPGVITPLSPLGSKLQTVWRYADLGWSIRDETKYNLDVTGLSWSPALGLITADFFEQFEIRLAHSHKLPDEQPRSPITGGMRYPISGLWDGPIPFSENILADSDSPVVVMHERSLGYRVEPRDLAFTAIGTPLMPWPINRTGGPLKTFTWRDTGATGLGGDFGAGVPLDIEVGTPLNLENSFGTFAAAGRVPTIGLPLLMEFRCYPSESGLGLNPLAIHLASNASAAPNFRAYATGGFDTQGQRVTRDPDLTPAPLGGFNPSSRPPGRPTARTADNSLYLGQLDYVIRLSRAHTVWIQTSGIGTRFAEVVLEPPEESFPPGTRILVEFRGANGFSGTEGREASATTLTPYGDPRVGTVDFWNGDPGWKADLRALDGARFVQARITFFSNIGAGLVAELSAIGITYTSTGP